MKLQITLVMCIYLYSIYIYIRDKDSGYIEQLSLVPDVSLGWMVSFHALLFGEWVQTSG